MADREVVIKIPEEMYKWVNDVNKFFDDYGISDFIDLVKNGTPLPKGHGRLIDADDIRVIELEDSLHFIQHKKGDDVDVYIDAPTIIEADREQGEKNERRKTIYSRNDYDTKEKIQSKLWR